MLREYQQKAVDSLFRYFQHDDGNPLVVAPTGSGKSHIIASFVEQALTIHPETRITILAHRKELLIQNSEKLLATFPKCPLGIFSAGLRKREMRQVTMAGIGTIFNKAEAAGYQNLVLVDEAHLIPKNGDGMYRTFLDGLKRTNSKLKVIGFTATPYRMDSGMLTDGEERLFTDISYEIELRYLINNGYLSPLISKHSSVQADLSDVRIRGGEFLAEDINRIMDDNALTGAALSEILRYGASRKSWIIFCAGVTHAGHVTEKLIERGIKAACVTGETPASERREILDDFKAGKIQALLNCDVLTTGFDAPNIDMLVLLRPTKSVGLYVQMCGRGCRLFEGKSNCLVLDFAGNIERFGPLDMVKVKKKRSGKAEAVEALTKTCPECENVLAIGVRECTCGFTFPEPEREKHGSTATEAPILSEVLEWNVDAFEYVAHTKNDKKSLRVKYLCGAHRVDQFVCLEHQGFALTKARQWWRCHHWDEDSAIIPNTVDEAIERKDELKRVKKISVSQDGKFWRVVGVTFFERDEVIEKEPSVFDEIYEKYGLNI